MELGESDEAAEEGLARGLELAAFENREHGRPGLLVPQEIAFCV